METIGASAIVLWLATMNQTFVPFAISVVVAPFLLMRTRRSTAYGVRLARRFIRWDEGVPDNDKWRIVLAAYGDLFFPFGIRV